MLHQPPVFGKTRPAGTDAHLTKPGDRFVFRMVQFSPNQVIIPVRKSCYSDVTDLDVTSSIPPFDDISMPDS